VPLHEAAEYLERLRGAVVPRAVRPFVCANLNKADVLAHDLDSKTDHEILVAVLPDARGAFVCDPDAVVAAGGGGGVEVWRCGGVKVWRCGGMEV
jgi:hypothetical protein